MRQNVIASNDDLRVPANFLDGRLPQRFWDKISPCPMTGCWIWMGNINRGGYGSFHFGPRRLPGRRTHRAHKFAYEAFYGEAKNDLDHKCRVRSCANPDHLESVTRKVNLHRGFGLVGMNARRSHCKHGHEFTTENTRIYRGYRMCRTCHRNNERERHRKIRMADN